MAYGRGEVWGRVQSGIGTSSGVIRMSSLEGGVQIEFVDEGVIFDSAEARILADMLVALAVPKRTDP